MDDHDQKVVLLDGIRYRLFRAREAEERLARGLGDGDAVRPLYEVRRVDP